MLAGRWSWRSAKLAVHRPSAAVCTAERAAGGCATPCRGSAPQNVTSMIWPVGGHGAGAAGGDIVMKSGSGNSGAGGKISIEAGAGSSSGIGAFVNIKTLFMNIIFIFCVWECFIVKSIS